MAKIERGHCKIIQQRKELFDVRHQRVQIQSSSFTVEIKDVLNTIVKVIHKKRNNTLGDNAAILKRELPFYNHLIATVFVFFILFSFLFSTAVG